MTLDNADVTVIYSFLIVFYLWWYFGLTCEFEIIEELYKINKDEIWF